MKAAAALCLLLAAHSSTNAQVSTIAGYQHGLIFPTCCNTAPGGAAYDISGTNTICGENAQFFLPTGIEIGASGDIFFSHSFKASAVKLTPDVTCVSGYKVSNWVESGGSEDILYDASSGRMYRGAGQYGLFECDPTTGAPIKTWSAPPFQLNTPTGLAIRNDTLFACMRFRDQVWKVAVNTNDPWDRFVLSLNITQPREILLRCNGEIWVSNGNQINVYSPGGTFMHTLANSGALGMAQDGNGDVFVANITTRTIQKYVGGTGSPIDVVGTGANGCADGTAASATFGQPYDLDIDQATGDIYVSDRTCGMARKVSGVAAAGSCGQQPTRDVALDRLEVLRDIISNVSGCPLSTNCNNQVNQSIDAINNAITDLNNCQFFDAMRELKQAWVKINNPNFLSWLSQQDRDGMLQELGSIGQLLANGAYNYYANSSNCQAMILVRADIALQRGNDAVSRCFTATPQCGNNNNPFPQFMTVFDELGNCSLTLAAACSSFKEGTPKPAPAPQVSLNAYPNPFQGSTTINFTLDQDENVTLKVYDIRGVMVKQLYDGPAQANARLDFTLGENDVPAGIYIARLQTASGLIKTHKLVKQN